MPRLSLPQIYQHEFRNYSFETLKKDFIAGLAISAVAFPLCVAFGVASGASAHAGLITAIIAGLIIGPLAGAHYQIYGPTGAASAILILQAQNHGLIGVWLIALLSGLMMLVVGALKLGRFIAFIPVPVVTGFTSGIAAAIAIGQLDNFFGTHSTASSSAATKLLHFLQSAPTFDLHAVVTGSFVILLMLLWPAKLSSRLPASLLAIIVAAFLPGLLGWNLASVGSIPTTFIPEQKLSLQDLNLQSFENIAFAALSLTAMSTLLTLFAGAVASKVSGVRLQANQDLIGQGIGNIILPFLGGIPATAGVARIMVGIRAGGQTRLVGVFQALILLIALLFAAPFISRIPLAALAGVLFVTALRMNDWNSIRFYFSKRLNSAIAKFLITLGAMLIFDLTFAILIGVVVSAALFLNQAAQLEVALHPVDVEKLKNSGIELQNECRHVQVAFLTGPLFFAAVGHFVEAFATLGETKVLVLSMRGVPLVDSSGLAAIDELAEQMLKRGGTLYFAGVHDSVRQGLEKAGVLEKLPGQSVFWNSQDAIVAASKWESLRR